MRTINIGKTELNLLNPPTEDDTVSDRNTGRWIIKRNVDGNYILKRGLEVHPAFVKGMDLLQFTEWVNSQL